MRPDRRIDPDYAEDQIDILRHLIAEAIAAKRTELGVETYNEFPKAMVKWIAGGIMVLSVSGIVGCVVMYGELQAVRAELTALRSNVDDLKRLVEPRYRGGPDVPTAR
jgi:hypothetical protein